MHGTKKQECSYIAMITLMSRLLQSFVEWWLQNTAALKNRHMSSMAIFTEPLQSALPILYSVYGAPTDLVHKVPYQYVKHFGSLNRAYYYGSNQHSHNVICKLVFGDVWICIWAYFWIYIIQASNQCIILSLIFDTSII